MSDHAIEQHTKGINSAGVETTIIVRGEDPADFAKNLTAVHASIKALKPLPIRTFGGGNRKRKEFKPLDNAPKCPEHDKVMHPKMWKGDRGVMFFWSCSEKTDGQWCKAKINSRPTPETYNEWARLNGEPEHQINTPKAETPTAKPQTQPKTTPTAQLPTFPKNKEQLIQFCDEQEITGPMVREILKGSVSEYMERMACDFEVVGRTLYEGKQARTEGAK